MNYIELYSDKSFTYNAICSIKVYETQVDFMAGDLPSVVQSQQYFMP